MRRTLTIMALAIMAGAAAAGVPISGEWRFYRSVSLPFECTGSVYGFVRVSQALWFVFDQAPVGSNKSLLR